MCNVKKEYFSKYVSLLKEYMEGAQSYPGSNTALQALKKLQETVGNTEKKQRRGIIH